MPNSFWITMGIVGFLIWAIPKWFKTHVPVKPEEAPMPEPTKVQFYGGPLDGMVQPVEPSSDFVVAPYLPRTEDGEVDISEAKVVGHMGDKVYFEPSLAYYQQIMDDSYFYVRDISTTEMYKLDGNSSWRPVSDDKTDTE